MLNATASLTATTALAITGLNMNFSQVLPTHLGAMTGSLYNGHKQLNFMSGTFEKSTSFYPTPAKPWRNPQQGGMSLTHDPMHMAIEGPGYFELSDGTYTRDGAFVVNTEGILCSADGVPVVDAGGGLIMVPSDSQGLAVQQDGEIRDRSGSVIGQLGLVEFEDLNALTDVGHNRFRSPYPPQPASESVLTHKKIEQSNVHMHEVLNNIQSIQSDCRIMSDMMRSLQVTRDKMPKHLLLTGN
jgi:flagellar basal body rod protein FlgG